MQVVITGRPVAAAALIAALAVTAGCGSSGSSVAAAGNASISAPATVASTQRSAQSPSALLDSALSAVQAQKSVHLGCAISSPSAAESSESEDFGAASGRAVDTTGDVTTSTMLVGGVAYFSTNTAGVLTAEGVPAAEAEKLAGKWIAIRPGESYKNSYITYARAISGMTFANTVDGLRLTGTLKGTGATRSQGVSVYGVSGGATGYFSTAGSPETVYIAASGAPLPVSVTAKSGDGTVTTCAFSQWGESLNLTAPAGAVPVTSIPT